MDNMQDNSELRYRLAVLLLDDLLKEGFINTEEYIKCRKIMIYTYKPPIGQLEDGLLWKKEE